MRIFAHGIVLSALAALLGCGRGGQGAPKTESDRLPPLSDAESLVFHGPYSTIDQHCNAFLKLDAAELGLDTGQLDYGCRTDVRVRGARIEGLGPEALGGGFERAKLFETSYVADAFAGRVRLALLTKSGWYLSDGLVDLTRSSEYADGGLSAGSLVARELDAATGLEFVFEGASDAAENSSSTAICRRSENGEPDCLVLGPGAKLDADGTVTVAGKRYRPW